MTLEDASKSRRFSRKTEDFTCEVCGVYVKGTGYTDHCPHCLSSKHVDVNPGDRKSKCHGLMEPIKAEYTHEDFIIYYKCDKCNFRHRVHSAKDDNHDLLVVLSS